MDPETFADAIRSKRAADADRLEQVRTQIRELHAEFESLGEAVKAWDTVLAREDAATSEGKIPAGPIRGLIDEVNAGQAKASLPPRQPGYENLTVNAAIQKYSETIDEVMDVDGFAKAIFQVSTKADISLAKRRIRGELRRAVRRGFLEDVARGLYRRAS